MPSVPLAIQDTNINQVTFKMKPLLTTFYMTTEAEVYDTKIEMHMKFHSCSQIR